MNEAKLASHIADYIRENPRPIDTRRRVRLLARAQECELKGKEMTRLIQMVRRRLFDYHHP